MTRFREEHYDTREHRAWVKVPRPGNSRRTGPTGAWTLTWSEAWGPLRPVGGPAEETVQAQGKVEEVLGDNTPSRKVVGGRIDEYSGGHHGEYNSGRSAEQSRPSQDEGNGRPAADRVADLSGWNGRNGRPYCTMPY